MQIIREVKKVSGKQIIIDLPETFYGKEVEVIVIPYKIIPSVDKKSEWKKDFSSVSQWDITEEDVNTKSWPLEEL